MEGLFSAAGAAAWGAVSFGDLAGGMSSAALAKTRALCRAPTGVFVAAFPYFAGDAPGNLSLYARGADYHGTVVRRLEGVCAALRVRWPGHVFYPLADNSPLPETSAALLAGLGVLGDNGLVLLEGWGSYVFLGTILTDVAPYPWPKSAPVRHCHRCGACACACPGGALGEGQVTVERCLSHLTQKTGELTPAEAALLAGHSLIWGCDTCQRVCPYNRDVPLTPLDEFRQDLMCSLSAADVAGLTRRQFLEHFPRRAFTWRGPAVLRRNLAGKQKNE